MMKYIYTLFSLLLFVLNSNGQNQILMSSRFDQIGDTSALQLEFGTLSSRRFSNANIGQWQSGALSETNKSITSFQERSHDVLNLRFHYKRLQIGFGTTLYNFNSRELSSDIFNVLYSTTKEGQGEYSYSNFSALKHSISLGRKLGEVANVSLIINAHQLNSVSELGYSGYLRNMPDELSANFTGYYFSSNNDFLDSTRSIAVLPNLSNSADSGHFSVYKNSPIVNTFGFYTEVNLSKVLKLNFFANHLGRKGTVHVDKQDNSYEIVIQPTEIETSDLISSGPLTLPADNYRYTARRGESRDSTYLRFMQPPVIGMSLEAKTSASTKLLVTSSFTRYEHFDNQRHSAIFKVNLADNYFLTGYQLENIDDLWLGNLIFGAEFKIAKRLAISCFSSTAANFIYLRQKVVPSNLHRLQFNISAEISLP